MISNYDIVKEQVDIVDVAERLGVSVDRNRRTLCPFHNDTHNPGLKFKKNNTFTCYACGAYGDVIDFASRMLGSSLNESLAWLNATYNLGLKLDEEVDQQLVQQINMEREHKKEIKKLVQIAAKSYCSYNRLLREWRDKKAPSNIEEDLDSKFIASLTQFDYIEYVCDTVFICGDYDTRRNFVLRNKKQLAKIIQILRDGDKTDKKEKIA